jgi:type I restriction enzyme, R subunit
VRRPLGEGAVELAALSWLDELGYRVVDGEEIAPDSETGERTSYHDVILSGRLRAALARLNPGLPQAAIEEIIRRIERSDTPSVVEENRRLHRMFAEGVDVQVPREDGGAFRTVKAWLVDCEEPQRNDWLVVRQFKVIENKYNRRADLVVFVNGLPLAVVELKNPGGPNASLEGAFNQLQTYKAEIPSLFRTNAFLVVSDGIQARIGSLTADVERFMPWRTTDGHDLAPKGTPELPVLLKGVLEKRRLLELVRGYTVFVERDGELIKIIAGYHQFHAVRHAVERTLAAAAPVLRSTVG